MDNQDPHLGLLLDLEARHDDLLERLERLDKQVEKVLIECSAVRQSAETPVGSGGWGVGSD